MEKNKDNTITGENDFNYEPTNINEVVITLKRGYCYGLCPVYTLTIYGNGTVVYKGEENVNISGTRTDNISEGEVRQLISEFEKIDYFSLNESDFIRILDVSEITTSLTINEKTKTIRHTGGPKELIELEFKIDEIVNSSQWTGQKFPFLDMYNK